MNGEEKSIGEGLNQPPSPAPDRVNPGDGGLPESTDVAGGVRGTPTPLTLLQITSHVQKLAC